MHGAAHRLIPVSMVRQNLVRGKCAAQPLVGDLFAFHIDVRGLPDD